MTRNEIGELTKGQIMQDPINHGKNHRFYSKVDGEALLGFEQGNYLILFTF